MRKLLLLFLLILVLLNALVAQEESADAERNETFERVEILLSDGVVKNRQEIYELSALLSEDERNALYNDYEQSCAKAMGLNMLGFGIGSFLQQDSFGGFTQLTASIAGWSALIGGIIFVANAESNEWEVTDYDRSSYFAGEGTTYGHKKIQDATAAGLGWGCITIGVCSLVANTIFGLVRPRVYTKKYNRMLKSNLRSSVEIDEKTSEESLLKKAARFIQEKRPQSTPETSIEPKEEEITEMSFSPIINPVSNRYGVSLRFSLP